MVIEMKIKPRVLRFLSFLCAMASMIAGEPAQPCISGNDIYHFTVTRYEFACRIEKLIIEKFPGHFEKSNDTLRIRLNNGKEKMYESGTLGYWCPTTIIDYLPDRELVLLRWQATGDDGAYILLDRKTGREIDGLSGIAVFSPHKKRFCTLSAGESYFSNEVSIYTLQPSDSAQLPEFTVKPEWMPVSVRWMNEKKSG